MLESLNESDREGCIESDGEGLLECTSSKKEGNDINKCTFIYCVVYRST